MIIVTSHEEGVKENIIKQAISIEEDPYFFKKQVLSISTEDFPIISSCFEENKEKYIPYVQHLISDIGRFMEFTSSESLGLSYKGVEYSFVAKLYEKLPFLTLIVKKSSQKDLQVQIDEKLSAEQQVYCNALLNLEAEKLDEWIAEIVKEVVDD